MRSRSTYTAVAGIGALVAVLGALGPMLGAASTQPSHAQLSSASVPTQAASASGHHPLAVGKNQTPSAAQNATVNGATGGLAGSTTIQSLRTQTSRPSNTASTAVVSGPNPLVSTPNLLIGNQATFNGTTGGWVGSNATLSSPGPGATSLQVTPTATSWVSAWSAFPPSGTPTPATPATKYTGQAAIETNNLSSSIADALAFFDASGHLITAVWGQAVTPGSSNWIALPEVAAIAPAGTASVVLGVMSWTAAVGQPFFIESPVLTALTTPPVAPPVIGPLHVSGNQIVQADGQQVTFHGLVMPGLEQTGTLGGSNGVTQRAVNEARLWGANFVRVPLGEQFWLSSNCDYVPTYTATVDQVVNWITSLGMVALLDLHSNTVNGCEPGGEHNMADAAQAPTFWSQVAARYGNPTSPQYNPLVAFDLYNEPHDISDATWLNGGQTTDIFGGETYQTAGMQQMYNAVRAAGSQNLVFISGNTWASTPPPNPVQGSNIVNAAHYYTCPDSAPPACNNPNPYDPTQALKYWVGLAASQPVMVTEFGWPSQGDGTYDTNVIAYASAQGWGWSAFAWEDRPYPTIWDLVSSWLGDGTAEPSPSGVPVLLGLSEAT